MEGVFCIVIDYKNLYYIFLFMQIYANIHFPIQYIHTYPIRYIHTYILCYYVAHITLFKKLGSFLFIISFVPTIFRLWGILFGLKYLPRSPRIGFWFIASHVKLKITRFLEELVNTLNTAIPIWLQNPNIDVSISCFHNYPLPLIT